MAYSILSGRFSFFTASSIAFFNCLKKQYVASFAVSMVYGWLSFFESTVSGYVGPMSRPKSILKDENTFLFGFSVDFNS